MRVLLGLGVLATAVGMLATLFAAAARRSGPDRAVPRRAIFLVGASTAWATYTLGGCTLSLAVRAAGAVSSGALLEPSWFWRALPWLALEGLGVSAIVPFAAWRVLRASTRRRGWSRAAGAWLAAHCLAAGAMGAALFSLEGGLTGGDVVALTLIVHAVFGGGLAIATLRLGGRDDAPGREA